MKLTIKSTLPDNSISHFVHSFWMLENKTGKDIPSTVLPNGMVDMILMKMNSANWEMVVRGIDTMPGEVTIKAGTKMFSIGFRLLAVEYLFGNSIRDVLNGGKDGITIACKSLSTNIGLDEVTILKILPLQ